MNPAAPDCMRDLLVHDIRTPLAILSGYTVMLRRRAVKSWPRLGDLIRDVESIEAAAKRAERMLDELARLAAGETVGSHGSQHRPVDLFALADRISAQTRAPGRQRITVVSSVPELVGWWRSDQLEHVLTNLFDNALKYSPTRTVVVVTMQRLEDCAVLKVADQGVGIPPKEIRKVFEPGYRASNVVDRFPGTGIALAGAYQIVAEHGGTLTVDSELEAGTTVTLCLPIRGEGET